MDADGSFSLKNLGKSSIFLNGREIATGKILNFASSNLIEVIFSSRPFRSFCQPSNICFSFYVVSSMLLRLGSNLFCLPS